MIPNCNGDVRDERCSTSSYGAISVVGAGKAAQLSRGDGCVAHHLSSTNDLGDAVGAGLFVVKPGKSLPDATLVITDRGLIELADNQNAIS